MYLSGATAKSLVVLLAYSLSTAHLVAAVPDDAPAARAEAQHERPRPVPHHRPYFNGTAKHHWNGTHHGNGTHHRKPHKGKGPHKEPPTRIGGHVKPEPVAETVEATAQSTATTETS